MKYLSGHIHIVWLCVRVITIGPTHHRRNCCRSFPNLFCIHHFDQNFLLFLLQVYVRLPPSNPLYSYNFLPLCRQVSLSLLSSHFTVYSVESNNCGFYFKVTRLPFIRYRRRFHPDSGNSPKHTTHEHTYKYICMYMYICVCMYLFTIDKKAQGWYSSFKTTKKVGYLKVSK